MSRPNNQQSQSGVCTLESSQFHKGSCTRMFTATAVEIRSWGHPSVRPQWIFGNILYNAPQQQNLLLPKGTHGVGGEPRYCYQNKPPPLGSFWAGLSCPPPGVRNCGSKFQSLVKRKGTVYSKVIQVQSNGGMSPLKSQRSFKIPPPTHTVLSSPLCPTRGTHPILGKRNRSPQLSQTPDSSQ